MSSSEVVEEVPVSNEDELENVDRANRARVLFAPSVVKKIVSPQSGSILADPDPVVKLSPELRERVVSVFSSALEGQETIKTESLPTLLFKCGFEFTPDQLSPVIAKYCPPDCSEMNESDFISFVEKFQAPDYYYGQRMRRWAGRGFVSDVVELLIRNCDVNTGDGEGLSSLHYASEFNRVDVIQALNDTVPGKLVVNCQDRYGWTPLYSACHHGNYDCVNLLLELGADPMVRNKVGKTALHAACAQGRSIIVDRLLRPTDPPAPKHVAATAPVAAPAAAAPAAAPAKGGKAPPPAKAAELAAAAAAEAAAAEAARVAAEKAKAVVLPFNPLMLQEVDSKGMTPLHEACYRGHGSLFQILSRNSTADVSQRDAMGYTAEDYLGDLLLPVEGGRTGSRGGARGESKREESKSALPVGKKNSKK